MDIFTAHEIAKRAGRAAFFDALNADERPNRMQALDKAIVAVVVAILPEQGFWRRIWNAFSENLVMSATKATLFVICVWAIWITLPEPITNFVKNTQLKIELHVTRNGPAL